MTLYLPKYQYRTVVELGPWEKSEFILVDSYFSILNHFQYLELKHHCSVYTCKINAY